MKKLINWLSKILLAGAISSGFTGALYLSENSLYPPQNEVKLQTILKEERAKLEIEDDVSISLRLYDEKTFGNARKLGEKKYEIELGGNSRNILSLKHEIYHIADGHCDMKIENKIDDIIKWIRYEPQAIIYESTGMRF